MYDELRAIIGERFVFGGMEEVFSEGLVNEIVDSSLIAAQCIKVASLNEVSALGEFVICQFGTLVEKGAKECIVDIRTVLKWRIEPLDMLEVEREATVEIVVYR